MTMPVVDGCRSGDDASNDNDSTDGDGSGNGGGDVDDDGACGCDGDGDDVSDDGEYVKEITSVTDSALL